MKLNLTRKRALYLTQLIKAGQEYLERTQPLDPIDIIKAGDGLLREIELQRNEDSDTATIKRKINEQKGISKRCQQGKL